MADSGIHSANDTQAPSISSKMGIDGSGMTEMTPTSVQAPASMMYDFDDFSVPPAYGQPQVNGQSGFLCSLKSVIKEVEETYFFK